MMNKFRSSLKEAFRNEYPRVPVDNPRYVQTLKGKAGVTITKGRYTLGEGKHGKVVKAYSKTHDCFVAIKSERLTGRTSAEELIQRSLKSPRVVRLFDTRDIGDKHYIVMELGERTLKEVAQNPGSLTDEQAGAYKRDLLEGLRDLHAEGVYHRDVKLGNLVIIDGRVKIIDFGKSVRHPGDIMQRTYERADAWAACRVIAELDTAMRYPDANAVRRKAYVANHALMHWGRRAPHITIARVMGRPSLKELFPSIPADSEESVTSRALSRAAEPFRRSFQFITAKLPLVRSLDLGESS